MNELLFIERAEKLNKILREKGAQFYVEYMTYYKNNICMDTYALKTKPNVAAPVIPFDMRWWEKSDADVADFLISMFNKNFKQIDTSNVLTYDYVKANIKPKLHPDSQIPFLKKAGHSFISFLDMVITFYIPLEEKVENDTLLGLESIVVTSSVLESVNISIADAYQFAVHNLSQFLNIIPLESILPKSMQLPGNCPMWVIGTSSINYGAAAILCPDAIKKISESLQGNIALLPSSIHEFVAVKYKNESDLKELKEMVVTINETQISFQDKLTDSVYILKEGEIERVF